MLNIQLTLPHCQSHFSHKIEKSIFGRFPSPTFSPLLCGGGGGGACDFLGRVGLSACGGWWWVSRVTNCLKGMGKVGIEHVFLFSSLELSFRFFPVRLFVSNIF